MPYIATVNNQSYSIDTGEDNPQRDILIDGASHSIDWRHLAPLAPDVKGHSGTGGRYSLIIAGKSYEVFARRLNKPDEKDGHAYEIQIAGQRFEVHVEDEREKTLASSAMAGRESSEAIVRAPMPGLVLGVLVDVGTSVEREQTVVVLEAMKMENNLASPMGGKVKEVRVSKGQTVNQGDVLVVIRGE
jgi:biotin carboxyl carrier protein